MQGKFKYFLNRLTILTTTINNHSRTLHHHHHHHIALFHLLNNYKIAPLLGNESTTTHQSTTTNTSTMMMSACLYDRLKRLLQTPPAPFVKKTDLNCSEEAAELWRRHTKHICNAYLPSIFKANLEVSKKRVIIKGAVHPPKLHSSFINPLG